MAETVYVHDQLRLGIRGAPDNAEKSIAVVKTGDALDIIGEDEHFIQIRTENGVEGWVSKGYVSPEPPATVILPGVQEELKGLKKQEASLRQKLAEETKRSESLQKQLSQMKSESEKLQLALNADSAESETAATDGGEVVLQDTDTEQSLPQQSPQHEGQSGLSYLVGFLLLVIGLLVGLVSGIRWKTKQVAERIGGLQI
ncbi:MAG: TIGR04211 family SH3 domain-containing protein [Chromatiales bacterium]|nr:TIGR04211 family SH3 domain-containing protein [Chromatiales bacterium]